MTRNASMLTSVEANLTFVGGYERADVPVTKIANFLLRANTAASNDNDRPVDKSLRRLNRDAASRASWQYPVMLICIVVFLMIDLASPP